MNELESNDGPKTVYVFTVYLLYLLYIFKDISVTLALRELLLHQTIQNKKSHKRAPPPPHPLGQGGEAVGGPVWGSLGVAGLDLPAGLGVTGVLLPRRGPRGRGTWRGDPLENGGKGSVLSAKRLTRTDVCTFPVGLSSLKHQPFCFVLR